MWFEKQIKQVVILADVFYRFVRFETDWPSKVKYSRQDEGAEKRDEKKKKMKAKESQPTREKKETLYVWMTISLPHRGILYRPSLVYQSFFPGSTLQNQSQSMLLLYIFCVCSIFERASPFLHIAKLGCCQWFYIEQKWKAFVLYNLRIHEISHFVIWLKERKKWEKNEKERKKSLFFSV